MYSLKGRSQDVRAIGALLGVSVVLEGTVRRAGTRLRINAQLSSAEDGRLFVHPYEGPKTALGTATLAALDGSSNARRMDAARSVAGPAR